MNVDGLTRGALAEQAEVHAETLRYYERRGILAKPPRSAGNYRLYPREALGRVRFVKRAQELGFTLKEVEELLALRATPGARARDVREKAVEKLEETDAKLRSLRRMRRALAELIDNCSGEGPATSCTILEALGKDARL